MTQPLYTTPVSDAVLAQIFTEAHTGYRFSQQPVTDETLEKLYDIIKWAPTAFNSQPGRFFAIRSPDVKAGLVKTLSGGNQQKTAEAPLTVVIATDSEFDEYVRELFPAYDVKAFFQQYPAVKEASAKTNTLLQAGYFILAARSLGLSVGPMTGFDADKVNALLFPDGRYQAQLVVNLGYATEESFQPRNPRLPHDVAWQTR